MVLSYETDKFCKSSIEVGCSEICDFEKSYNYTRIGIDLFVCNSEIKSTSLYRHVALLLKPYSMYSMSGAKNVVSRLEL